MILLKISVVFIVDFISVEESKLSQKDIVETILVTTSLGKMHILATSTSALKHIIAFEGYPIFIIGKCTMIYNVPIIIHSFLVETPSPTAKNTFNTMAPISKSFIEEAADDKT